MRTLVGDEYKDAGSLLGAEKFKFNVNSGAADAKTLSKLRKD